MAIDDPQLFFDHSLLNKDLAKARFLAVREQSVKLADPLEPEDTVVQSMPDVSPTKWHLAHSCWYWETFVLEPYLSNYKIYDKDLNYILNSYYNAAGSQYPRPERGLLSRPTLSESLAYRKHVDHAIIQCIDANSESENWPTIVALLDLGCQHEEQHQELILTDIKHVLSKNPLRPAYQEQMNRERAPLQEMRWVPFERQIAEIGHDGVGFAFDCEAPRHEVLIRNFELASRLITNREYLAFMKDDGYNRSEFWLSDGWQRVQEEGWKAPLYWIEEDGKRLAFSMFGMQPLDPNQPVCHLSFFEADAYARWAGSRLPREEELEFAMQKYGNDAPGNDLSSGALEPAPAHPCETIAQLIGDVWEWTSSPFTPYPGFKPAPGAVGEYNGKFMNNQYVLKGGSCFTPKNHIRASYRNFFFPWSRWQVTGLRLARDVDQNQIIPKSDNTSSAVTVAAATENTSATPTVGVGTQGQDRTQAPQQIIQPTAAPPRPEAQKTEAQIQPQRTVRPGVTRRVQQTPATNPAPAPQQAIVAPIEQKTVQQMPAANPAPTAASIAPAEAPIENKETSIETAAIQTRQQRPGVTSRVQRQPVEPKEPEQQPPAPTAAQNRIDRPGVTRRIQQQPAATPQQQREAQPQAPVTTTAPRPQQPSAAPQSQAQARTERPGVTRRVQQSAIAQAVAQQPTKTAAPTQTPSNAPNLRDKIGLNLPTNIAGENEQKTTTSSTPQPQNPPAPTTQPSAAASAPDQKQAEVPAAEPQQPVTPTQSAAQIPRPQEQQVKPETQTTTTPTQPANPAAQPTPAPPTQQSTQPQTPPTQTSAAPAQTPQQVTQTPQTETRETPAVNNPVPQFKLSDAMRIDDDEPLAEPPEKPLFSIADALAAADVQDGGDSGSGFTAPPQQDNAPAATPAPNQPPAPAPTTPPQQPVAAAQPQQGQVPVAPPQQPAAPIAQAPATPPAQQPARPAVAPEPSFSGDNNESAAPSLAISSLMETGDEPDDDLIQNPAQSFSLSAALGDEASGISESIAPTIGGGSSPAEKKDPLIEYIDLVPPIESVYDSVVKGLTAGPKYLPSKLFYDEEGSILFKKICETPEYYPTRIEKDILRKRARTLSTLIADKVQLVEFGSGASEKVRILLSTVKAFDSYVPIDISEEILRASAEEIAQDFKNISVTAICADFTQRIELPKPTVNEAGGRLGFFPGSTIGNFNPEGAVNFLKRASRILGKGSGFVVGVDLKKEAEKLDAAYNDEEGLTAQFNLNILSRINKELDADFNLDNFEHIAFYNESEGRVEMHLASRKNQVVNISGEDFKFAEGETIHTENSYKYTVREFQDIAREAGLEPVTVWEDPLKLFSVHFLRVL